MLVTREELSAALPRSTRPLNALAIRRYWQRESEELFEVHRCELAAAASACHFCIESIRNRACPPKGDAWWQTYGQNFLFQPTDEVEIERRLGEIRGTRWPDALAECGPIRKATKLFDEWNLWWVVGQSDEAWIAIYWETTA